MSSGNGSIRAFVRNLEDNIEESSNEIYDEHIFILSRVAIPLSETRKNDTSLLN